MKKTAISIILTFLALAPQAHAQNMILANPADFSDFKAAFVNPAIISFQKSYAAIGGKVYHLGFVEGESSPFRQGMASLVLPVGISDDMGLGTQLQYFNSPIYSQSNITFALSKRFQRKYAFGVKFNVFSKSFNRNNFDLVDPNDPVFQNGTTVWSATFGAGASFFPLPYLSLGVGIDHINRANISLTNDNVYQPLATYVGAALDLGMVQASISTSYEDGRFLPKTSLGSSIYDVGYFRIGYGEQALQAEAQVKITGPLSLNYSYSYTLFDNEGFGRGSHQLTLLHEFDRKRKLPDIYMPDEFVLDFQPPDRATPPEARFYVYSSENKLEMIEKKIRRVVDPSVAPEELAQLTQYEIGQIDSSVDENPAGYDKAPVNMQKIPATLEAPLSKEYEKYLKEVSENLNKKGFKANVVTSKDSYLRAAGLRRYLTSDSLSSQRVEFVEPVFHSREDSLRANQKIGQRTITPMERHVTLSKKATTFQIMPVSYVLTPREWALVIENQKGREVKRFKGTGMPDSEILWDWRDQQGSTIAPGLYAYYFEWRDPKDIEHQTEKKYITVQKLLRTITVEITKNPKAIGEDVDEIDIILKE